MILLIPSTAKYSVGRLSASRGWTEGGREGGKEGGKKREGGREGRKERGREGGEREGSIYIEGGRDG